MIVPGAIVDFGVIVQFSLLSAGVSTMGGRREEYLANLGAASNLASGLDQRALANLGAAGLNHALGLDGHVVAQGHAAGPRAGDVDGAGAQVGLLVDDAAAADEDAAKVGLEA